MIVFLRKCPKQEDPAGAIIGTLTVASMSLALGKASRVSTFSWNTFLS